MIVLMVAGSMRVIININSNIFRHHHSFRPDVLHFPIVTILILRIRLSSLSRHPGQRCYHIVIIG